MRFRRAFGLKLSAQSWSSARRINSTDGTYAAEYWIDPDSTDDPDDNEYSENLEELRARALTVLKAGRFRYCNLCRWNAGTQAWDILEVVASENSTQLTRGQQRIRT